MALTDNLISHWKLDEASGQRNDAHGTNHLTDNNTVTQNPGKIGNAAQFTAVNSEYLSIADNDAISVDASAYTLAMWIYLDSKPDFMFVWEKSSSASPVNGARLIVYNPTTDRFYFQAYNNDDSELVVANNFGVPPLNTWLFVVAWRNGSPGTLNISVNDGTPNSISAVYTATDSGQTLYIGSTFGTAYFHNGRIDSVGFWKRVLTADERTWLYNGGNGRSYEEIVAGKPLSAGVVMHQGVGVV